MSKLIYYELYFYELYLTVNTTKRINFQEAKDLLIVSGLRQPQKCKSSVAAVERTRWGKQTKKEGSKERENI